MPYASETKRLRDLHALHVLDSDPEPLFDALAQALAKPANLIDATLLVATLAPFVVALPMALQQTLTDEPRKELRSSLGAEPVPSASGTRQQHTVEPTGVQKDMDMGNDPTPVDADAAQTIERINAPARPISTRALTSQGTGIRV